MADIQSAAQWLGRLLVEEATYLYKVEDKVKELRDELDWMQCFLRDTDASQYDNVMARRWVAQIREFAYEAEDTIESFLVRVVTTSRGRRDLFRLVRKYSKILLEARLVHQIGSNIDSLKNKISTLTSKLHTYGIKLKMEGSLSYSKLRNKDYIGSEEKKFIGRDNELKEYVDLLVEEAENKLKVLSIHGDGGVGKTFLAKKIFQDKRIRKYFDSFAWAYVSQPCQSSAVQQDLLSCLISKSKVQIAQMIDSEMKNELCKVQRKKKCFIVLDGIWEKEVWDSLKEAFPLTSHDFRSKLLITNESVEVAKHVYPDVHICELKGLNHEDSKKLLEEKLRDEICNENQPSSSSLPVYKEDYSDHDMDARTMDNLKEDMLKHCKGLPLAISVLGGLLATKRTVKEWEKVENYIRSPSVDDHGNVPSWKRIIELSYYDLQYELKPSFLYLGYFPTNLEIPTTKIIRLWEAEGLVSLPGDDESSEDTLEVVAEKWLGELVQRSLVQVGSRSLTGKAKTCRVHDLMREFCMTKAKQGNWLSIVKFGVDEDQPSGTPSSSKYPKKSKPAKRKFRHLAIYYSSSTSGQSKLPSNHRHSNYIRSLLFFNTLATENVLIPLKRLFLEKIFQDYKLLRVLDIENIEVQKLPDSIGYLIHLRYLSIKGSWVSWLPSSIGNLRCLQTLDLRVLSFVRVRIPDVLCKMWRLMHLYLPSKASMAGEVDKVIHLKDLPNLETLVNFSNICNEEDLAELGNLRKFSSHDFLFDIESIKPLLGSPGTKLKNIEHLSLRLDGCLLKEITHKLDSCKKLRVKGQVPESPESFRFDTLLQNLIKLSFCNTKFRSDPMEVLGELIDLRKLSLKHGSFVGSAMKCSKTGFQRLKYLTLKGLENLEDWTVEQGAMPNLFHLNINRCQKLKMIPFVKSLQELEISYMPFSFFGKHSPQEIEKWVHYPKLKHIPYLKISNVLVLDEVSIEVLSC